MASGVRGLHVPLVTPFGADGAVDLAALERLAAEVLDDGADGLVALATTAEASSLDARERDAVLEVCAAVARDRGAALIAGAGTNDTRTTIARHEARPHAEALLPLVLALFAEPSPAVLKALLHEAGRIATPDVRMPLQNATPAAVERARRSEPSRWSARDPARAR
jgi:dihydrodipicolinate synthase/N-acetylneuraminate lyase